MLTIRRCHSGDMSLIRALRLRAREECPDFFASSYEEEEARLDSDIIQESIENLLYGAWFDDGLIAIAGLHIKGVEGYIYGLYVNPDWRRQKIASQLLSRVIEDAPVSVSCFIASIVPRNEEATKLFIELKFSYYVTKKGRLLRANGKKEDLSYFTLKRAM